MSSTSETNGKQQLKTQSQERPHLNTYTSQSSRTLKKYQHRILCNPDICNCQLSSTSTLKYMDMIHDKQVYPAQKRWWENGDNFQAEYERSSKFKLTFAVKGGRKLCRKTASRAVQTSPAWARELYQQEWGKRTESIFATYMWCSVVKFISFSHSGGHGRWSQHAGIYHTYVTSFCESIYVTCQR